MTVRSLPRHLLIDALLLAFLLLGFTCAQAAALDLADGRLKLTLHEEGGISLSCRTGGQDGLYVPLIASQDPRTTFLSVVVGNKVYRMGASPEFSQAIEKTSTGGRFLWRSQFLQVTETFTFIAMGDSTESNGVRVDIGLKNISQQDMKAGVRYLFDTYLGEASFVHFRTDSLTQITNELALSGSSRPAFWVSPLVGDPQEFGFIVMCSGPGITAPDKIVFANWKRLSDSSWIYDTSASRNFSMLPFSVNDSAASEYFDPRPLPRGAERTVTMAFGQYSKSGSTVTTQSVAQALTTVETAVSREQGVRADLATVDNILSLINAGLQQGAAVSDEDLLKVESALKELEGRAGRYAPHANE
jgi:hypothetical protein